MTMVVKRVTRLIADRAEGERESCAIAVLRDTLLPTLIPDESRISHGTNLSVETRA